MLLTRNHAQLNLVHPTWKTVSDVQGSFAPHPAQNPPVASYLMNQEQQSSSAVPSQNESPEMGTPPLKPCVLLVEDDRSVRRYLEVTLQRSGYRVLTAADGLEAMKLALSSSVDVVVTDAIMPNLSGHELARFLRSNAKVSGLPIVLLTGQENREPHTFHDAQIDAFLYKPVNAKELTSCLNRLLTKRRSPKQ
jgi:CheY-like chemotaxis protein